jgi:hypothetical protein
LPSRAKIRTPYLKDIALARHHLVQDWTHNAAEEESRDQAGHNDDGQIRDQSEFLRLESAGDEREAGEQ